MIRFQVLTLFPELIQNGVSAGVLAQGIKKSLLQVDCIQLRDFASDTHRHVDDRPFGGGDGMVMMPEIVETALGVAKSSSNGRVIYLSPQGQPLTHEKVKELSKQTELILICGRYGGVDERALQASVDDEISIGDYVLSGGELPALVLIDAISRQIPGVLGHVESVDQDSFAHGLLEHPLFTRPRVWKGQAVPEVLLSGDHVKIQQWKLALSWLVTLKKRPDLLKGRPGDEWQEMHRFWQKLEPSEKQICGVSELKDQDFIPLGP